MTRVVPLLLLLAACRGGGDDSGESRPEPIPQVEIDRGQTACRDLADRTCRCAAGKPELAQACEDARALPDALKMNVDAAAAGGVERRVQLRLQYEARRTMARCFEDLNRLATLGCK